MSETLGKRHALRDHDAQPGSGSRLAVARERYVGLGAPRPEPRSCLRHNGSVVNATGKNATPRMFTKYSVHRSSPFISGSLVQQKTQERRKFATANTRRQPQSKQGAASYGLPVLELSFFRVELAPRLSARTPFATKLGAVVCHLAVARRICPQRRERFVRTRVRLQFR